MRTSIITAILFYCINFSNAQELPYCGTEGTHVDWENYLKDHKNIITRTFGEEVYVPITVHVLGDDNGLGYMPLTSLFRSLATLNKDFENTGIKFFLSGPINYINETKWYDHEDFTTGAQMMNANNVPNTINSYIVEGAANNCGYRSFNGDAVALAKGCNQPNDHTWAHEIGHWLSLPHTFLGWEGKDYVDEEDTPAKVGNREVEKVDGSNCANAADRFCDTSPDYLSYRWNCNDKNEFPDSLKDPSGERFAVDGSLFMSYAFDGCQSRFSSGQIDEMRTYLENFVPEVVSDDEPLEEVNPSQTNLIFPVNGEKVDNTVQLQWEDDGSATFYIVEVSQQSSMSILSLRELVYGNSLDVFGLRDNKKYYWRLRPMNEYDYTYDKITVVESFETGELSSTDNYYEKNLKIFPNPVVKGSTLQITLETEISENIILDLINLEGRTVQSDEYYLSSGSNELELSSSALTSGIYILRGRGELHNFQKKIVVE